MDIVCCTALMDASSWDGVFFQDCTVGRGLIYEPIDSLDVLSKKTKKPAALVTHQTHEKSIVSAVSRLCFLSH